MVDAKGAAIPAGFASVVDAAGSAEEIQRELAEQNAGLPGERRMDFRIGINLAGVRWRWFEAKCYEEAS